MMLSIPHGNLLPTNLNVSLVHFTSFISKSSTERRRGLRISESASETIQRIKATFQLDMKPSSTGHICITTYCLYIRKYISICQMKQACKLPQLSRTNKEGNAREAAICKPLFPPAYSYRLWHISRWTQILGKETLDDYLKFLQPTISQTNGGLL